MHTTYIVRGSPGAGKSTYARQLASARQAALLDIDTVTERLVRLALDQSGHAWMNVIPNTSSEPSVNRTTQICI